MGVGEGVGGRVVFQGGWGKYEFMCTSVDVDISTDPPHTFEKRLKPSFKWPCANTNFILTPIFGSILN